MNPMQRAPLMDACPDLGIPPLGDCPPLDIEEMLSQALPPNVEYLPPAVVEPAEPPVIQTAAVRIERAITGTMELRLLSQMEDGVHKRYVIEKMTSLAPYTKEQTTLVTKQRKKAKQEQSPAMRPMDKAEALLAFEAAKADMFPRATLRSGASIPTSICLL